MQLADGRMESIEAALAAMLQERLLTVEQDTFTLKGENAALKSQVNQLADHKLERRAPRVWSVQGQWPVTCTGLEHP